MASKDWCRVGSVRPIVRVKWDIRNLILETNMLFVGVFRHHSSMVHKILTHHSITARLGIMYGGA